MSKAKNKAEDRALSRYPVLETVLGDINEISRIAFTEGYQQAERDVAEAFARIIRGNLSGIGNGIQNMFEQLYTDITGERMYGGFKD